MEEEVDPTGQSRGQGGTVVRRYTQPPLPTPQPQPAPITPVSGQNPASGGLLGFDEFSKQRTGVDENAIRENVRKYNQTYIDAINAETAQLLRREDEAGAGRLDKVRAINVNAGLGGSTFATSRDLEQKGKNEVARKAIQDEQAVKVAAVYSNIDKTAREEITARKAEALGHSEAYTEYLTKAQEQSKGMLGNLAKSNVDLSKIDPARKSFLLRNAYGDEGLGELIYDSMKPKQQQVDWKFEKLSDGKGMFWGIDPTTGEPKRVEVNVEVPPDFSLTVTPDGTPLLFNKQTGEAKIVPGFRESQFRTVFASEVGGGGGGGSTGSGTLGTAGTPTPVKLPAAQQELITTMDTVNDLADKILSIGQQTQFSGVGGFGQGTVNQFLAKNFGKGTPEGEELRNLIGTIKGTIAKLRGGTSFTPNEEKLLNTYTPGINDSPLVIQSKLKTLKEFIETLRINTINNASGITPSSSLQQSQDSDPLNIL